MKLWGRIRRELIKEGNLKKYILYAVGEILIVLIGILLALQVNSWHESIKRKREEISFLHGFELDIESDLNVMASSSPIMHRAKASMNFILDYMKQDLPWNDSLKLHFGNISNDWTPTYNFNTYESITSKDWSIIRNEQLRNKLTQYYRNLKKRIKQMDRYTNELFEISRSVLNTRFQGFWDSNYDEWKLHNDYQSPGAPDRVIAYAIPLNFEKLKSDQEYRYSIIRLRNIYNWYRETGLESSKKMAENLRQVIEQELRKLEK